MATRHPFRHATLLAFSALLLTACGGSGGGGSDSATTPPSGTGSGTPPAANLVSLSDGQVALYYKRDDDAYDGWGLHLWNGGDCTALADSSLQGVDWANPKAADGISPDYGAYYILNTTASTGCINFIIHKGDEKALGSADKQFDLSQGRYAFTFHGNSTVYYEPVTTAPVQLEGAAAHWLSPSELVYQAGDGNTVTLYYSEIAGISVDVNADPPVSGGTAVSLTATTLSDETKAAFPHLASWSAWQPDVTAEQAATLARSQLVVAETTPAGKLVKATQVQTPGLIDALFYTDAPLGARVESDGVHFDLWAPTAQSVTLHLYDADKNELAGSPVSMTRGDKGVWTYVGDSSLNRTYYRYEITVYHPATGKVETLTVTDPWSLSLSANSQYSQVVDLDDADLKPAGWDSQTVPTVSAPEDATIYETHIRDFSASDPTVPEAHRGKYLAFTDSGTDGMTHLQALKTAGLTHIQLLPAFDIATIDEDPASRVDLDNTVAELCALKASAAVCSDTSVSRSMTLRALLESYDPTTGKAQALMNDLRSLDSFNWGYDPYHYSAPEGSYATNPEGTPRIVEFRQMVKALHDLGLRVVMDVVYNHTNASGVADKSVLDKVVPGYYHRLDDTTGDVANSTCCANTASEHRMMARLMRDSLVVWARDYKIDGFRFDLMGHHMRQNMIDALAAVQAVDPDTYFYGEGWNFGEVADNARGTNATQLNMAGTGIGTFSDRLRDAVRGGGPFDSMDALRTNQGFANGLYTLPNEKNSGADTEKTRLLELADIIRVGLAGNLKDFVFTNKDGINVTGKDVDYNGQPAGYTDDPQEVISYVSKHDNQTLWDNNQYKIASSVPTEDRVRMQLLGLSFPLFGQGVPFIHMGSELLRSKSMQRDSYDSGDWFNRVDFSKQDNNWNVGLPRQDKDGDNWPLILTILADTNADPTATDIDLADRVFRELLSIRNSSPLFHLTTRDEVMKRVDFRNTGKHQIPGVIAMSIDDGLSAGADLDSQHEAIVVIFNGTNQSQTLDIPGASGFALHPVQQSSADTRIRSASVSGSQFTVPALTTTVFVKAQSGAQGNGLPVEAKSLGERPPYGNTTVYLRGSLNGWTTDNPLNFEGGGVYASTVTLTAGTYEFKFANENWTSPNIGWGGFTTAADSIALSDPGNGNIQVVIPADGDYVFTLNAADTSALQVSVKAAMP